ncbi:MAG TPA: hypothetical protein VEB19_17620 [Gemmatimonadaceae bacterium]|nr:hypothetical protein [Gemmatimonadaceae bacterium]
MTGFLRPMVRTLGLTVGCASVLGAQQTEKACEVNESRPTAIGKATIAIQVASGATDPTAAARQLTAAVKGLTENAERMDNQVGRNLVLGKTLVLWTMQPNIEMVTTRGSLGYATDPQGTIDLAAAIDSAFRVVEAANPECASETARWRGQKGWVTLVNTAIERLNADDLEAAEAAADKAILLNPFGPYGYVVKANVAQKRERSTAAMELYRKAVDVASKDTTYIDIKRQSLIYLGNIAADSAEGTPDAAGKKPYIDAARQAFEEILKDPNAGEMRANAQAGMCRVAIASGDTTVLRSMYKDQLASPAGFAYNDLMNAGVCMARAEMVPEATTLFRSALEKNSHHRDALSNLAIMLLRKDEFEAAIPVASRLVSVEPNNQENMQLLMLSYAGIAKRARDQRAAGLKAGSATKAKAGATKTGAASGRLSQAVIDSLFKFETAYTDSAVKLNERREGMTMRVSLSDFTSSEEKAVVAGNISNTGTADKNVTMKVEFLDRTGNTIATKDVPVAVPAGKSARFNATVTPGNKEITAFKYHPIS